MDKHANNATLFANGSLEESRKPGNGRCVLYVVLLIIGLSIGVWVGFSFGGFSRELLTGRGRLPHAAVNFGPDQRKFLAIGVDDIAPEARLVGVWFVAYLPDRPRITLVPLYPLDNSDSQVELREAFGLDSQLQVRPEFYAELARQYRLDWGGDVLLDRTAMIKIVDFLGGVYMDEELLDGALAVGGPLYPWQAPRNPQAALDSQVRLLKGLCERISPRETPKEVGPVQDLIDDHLRTNFDLNYAENDWLRLVASAPSIYCEFPSLQTPGP